MKKFIIKVSIYLMLIVLSLLLLDGLYTAIYSNSEVRNKVQFVLNAPTKHYDAIILGSSRAENHIISEMFKKQGLNVYNFAMSGGSLCDDSLLLKLFFEKGNTTAKILLQVDLQFLAESPAIGVQASFMPYFTTHKTIYNHYKNNTENLFALAYVPFYRYCKLDSKIGFRELLLTLMNKKGKFYDLEGFAPLEGNLNPKITQDLPVVIPEKNKYFNEIVAISKKQKAQLIPFMAPFCRYVNHDDFFLKLKQKVPELYDYSNVIKEDSLFATCGHLNQKGAKSFTAMLLEKHFRND